MWTLPAPPAFKGLQPDAPGAIYQRHLPHWRQDGATYFATFRLGDSLPQSKLDELAELKRTWSLRGTACLSRSSASSANPLIPQTAPTAQASRPAGPTDSDAQELARQVQQRIERWLDQGMGSCHLKQPAFAAFLTSTMHRFDEKRYELDCYVVMPNHAHVIVRPLVPHIYPLEMILGGWKKYTARQINEHLHQTGGLWQDESYDRIIRDEEHLWRTIQYIGANPRKARLEPESCPLWIRPQWEALGWKFEGVA